MAFSIFEQYSLHGIYILCKHWSLSFNRLHYRKMLKHEIHLFAFFFLYFCFLHIRFNILDISAEFRCAVIQPKSCAYNLQAMDFLPNPPISSDLFADHVFIILGLLNMGYLY
jgi:hypothetical protein